MPETPFPGHGEEPEALEGAPAELPADDLVAPAQRRLEYDERRAAVEAGLERDRAELTLARLEQGTAERRRAAPQAAERWDRLTGAR